MPLTYNDIYPELSGTLIRDILNSFIKKDGYILNKKFSYKTIQDENQAYECILYNDRFLVYKFSKCNNFNIKFMQELNFLIVFNDTIHTKEVTLPRMSTEQFKEDEFSLSTLLSPDSMYDLKCSTYFSDIDLGTDIVLVSVNDIIECYLDIHTTPL